MDAIFFVLRTGCHWADLNATGICSSSAAHRRYMTWVAAGVFLAIRDLLPQCDAGADGLDWAWYPRPSPAGAAPEPARLPG
jgi:transposase